MKRLLAIVFLAGCAGSLVDHSSLVSGGDAGGNPAPTQACIDSCNSAPPGANPRCIGDLCDYECTGGKLKCADGCCPATSVSAGLQHTCAVAGGAARCWGSNDDGQLGRPGDSSSVPVKVEAITGTVTAVAAGSAHSCAIANGDVWCWGNNTSGQLGDGTIGAAFGGSTARKITTSAGALHIAAGFGHTCYSDASQVFCWGRDDQGQIGDGALMPATPRTSPTAVTGLGGALDLAAGDNHTCAIAATGGVFCWGSNGAGQLGIGSGSAAKSTPEQIQGFSFAFIGLGANHSCGGASSGALSCWGANASFQVDGSGQDQRSPKGSLSGVSAVTGGIGHTCALRQNDVTCWGLNTDGQVSGGGDGRNPVDVVGIAGATAVAAGYAHTCAIAGGAVLCWGSNTRGQLGTDVLLGSHSTSPQPVSGR